MIIDLWADVACPWCYVGERRLQRALRDAGMTAEIRWRPYQLQPALSASGVPWNEFVERKFGGWDRARTMFAHVAAAGAAEGIRFDFEHVATSPNTVAAHRVILLAQREGLLNDVAEAIFAAHFSRGRDVTDAAVLADAAADAGLSRERVLEMLAGQEYREEVRSAAGEARRQDIDGVPFFIFDGRLAFSGAQPFEVFLSALEQVRAA